MTTDNEDIICKTTIGSLCNDYLQDIEGLSESLPFIMSALVEAENFFDKKLNKFIDESATEINEEEDGRTYSVKLHDKPKHDDIHRNLRIFRQAINITPRSYLVSLVSAYDAFLGRLINQLFYIKPELLNSSERVLTFSQLQELADLDSAREYLVEKEVETVLRKSHAQQFEWMENTYSIPLKKGLSCWPLFIEIMERRNLFVHADGYISSQYLKVCETHSVKISEHQKLNSRLFVEPLYYEKAANCLLEVGIKLSHVLWRKLVCRPVNSLSYPSFHISVSVFQ